MQPNLNGTCVKIYTSTILFIPIKINEIIYYYLVSKVNISLTYYKNLRR